MRAVARALAPLTRAWLHTRYLALKKHFLWFAFNDYNGPVNESHFAYIWGYFEQMRTLYRKAAADNRAMLFTVVQ